MGHFSVEISAQQGQISAEINTARLWTTLGGNDTRGAAKCLQNRGTYRNLFPGETLCRHRWHCGDRRHQYGLNTRFGNTER